MIAGGAGGVGGFAGAFAAIKVHIHYINKHQERQDRDIIEAKAKADLALERVERMGGVTS
jgi:hypothetical protein